MITFIVGLFVGAIAGLFIAAMLGMAHEREQEIEYDVERWERLQKEMSHENH